jgi:phosphoglucosamine mutase
MQDTEALCKWGYRLGRAQKGKSKVAVAEDNRPTSKRIVGAVLAGLTDADVDIIYGGVLPTAALQYGTKYFTADAGIMVTASHNPPKYNGLKYFDGDGLKPTAEELEAMEAAMEEVDYHGEECAMTPTDNMAKAYLEKFQSVEKLPLRIAVDCANGAAYPMVKRIMGKHIEDPLYLHHGDGKLINRDCGALHPEILTELTDVDMSFALDGDGDRCILVTKTGRVVTGDGILYLLAKYYRMTGVDIGGAVVSTVMANGALGKALSDLDLRLIRTDVGDQSVAKAMREKGCVLGGEPSGHILMADGISDGIATGLCLSQICNRYDLDKLLEDYVPLPQYHTQLPMTAESLRLAKTAEAKWQDYLAETGRVVVRPSGTEPVVRVMVECQSMHLAKNIGDSIKEAAKRG